MKIPIHEINDKNELVVLKEEEVYVIPRSTDTYARMLNQLFDTQSLKEEHGFIIAVDKKRIPIGILENIGNAKSVKVKYDEIALYLKLTNAHGFIISHNHPNGVALPSRADLDVLMRLTSIFQKQLIDDIIVGGYGDDYVYSFRDEEYFKHKDDMVDWYHTRNHISVTNRILKVRREKNELQERLFNLEKVLKSQGIIDIKNLTNLPNIGKNLAEKMLRAGIYNRRILDKKGSKAVWLAIRRNGDRATRVELYALEGAKQRVLIENLPIEVKNDLNAFFKKHQRYK